MNLMQALEQSSDVDTFLTELVPEVHDSKLDKFNEFFDVPIILSFKFRDTGDCITLRLHDSGCDVEEREMIDFPIVTVVSEKQHWDRIRNGLMEVGRHLNAEDPEEHVDDFRINRSFIEQLEKYDGVFEVEIIDEKRGEPIELSLVLNDYEHFEGVKHCRLSFDWDAVETCVEHQNWSELSTALSLEGQPSLAMDVGGVLLRRIPLLDEVWSS